jgi:hypothetical protein
VPEEPYLVLTIRVYRGHSVEAIALLGNHELARAEGAELADVLPALMRAIVRTLV